jgi:RNA polymerase sigma factor (sigma-70 family)
MFKIIILISFVFQCLSLTNDQWISINSVLKNKNIGFSNNLIKQQTRNIIYNSYETWAIKKSYVFKQYHSYLCRDIRGDELSIYGCIGLKKAVDNYDPNKCGLFTKYADFYLKNELYKGVRKLKPINTNIDDFTINNIYSTSENNNLSIIDKNIYSEKWLELCNTLNAFEYRCLLYKYSFDFKKQMSNAEVAKLMCCSEEHVRKVIIKLGVNLQV